MGLSIVVSMLTVGCEDNELGLNGNNTIIVSGVWLDVAGDGSETTITLAQSGNEVVGSFFDEKGWTGTITGSVNGNLLFLTYTYSDGYVVYNSATVDNNVMSDTF